MDEARPHIIMGASTTQHGSAKPAELVLGYFHTSLRDSKRVFLEALTQDCRLGLNSPASLRDCIAPTTQSLAGLGCALRCSGQAEALPYNIERKNFQQEEFHEKSFHRPKELEGRG